MFGDHRVCGAFPTSSPVVRRQQSILVQVRACPFFHWADQADHSHAQDTPQIVRLHSKKAMRVPYMCFDEAYFKTLEGMQWNRDNGCVELIPIVVGMP